MRKFFQRYLLPGLIFQSVVIAGGYGTGRELVEFFLEYGPTGGLLGMVLISMPIWSLVCASTFEFARTFKAYEYRSFFRELLGGGWILFEICYAILLLIVLAVVASAAGSILAELFGWPYLVGVLGMLGAVGWLVVRGSAAIEAFLSTWSLLLYVVYTVLFVLCLWIFGERISASLSAGEAQPGWLLGGVRYAAYNLGVIPAVLFVVRRLETRREAIVAGLLAGPLAIFPGLLFLVCMSGHYPEILEQTVPANFLLEVIGSRAFQLTFQLVLFGTLIETGTGFIHSVVERVAAARGEGTNISGRLKLAICLLLLAAGALIAQFGLVGLIAQGYGTITWGFLLIYVLPVLTLGWFKIGRRKEV